MHGPSLFAGAEGKPLKPGQAGARGRLSAPCMEMQSLLGQRRHSIFVGLIPACAAKMAKCHSAHVYSAGSWPAWRHHLFDSCLHEIKVGDLGQLKELQAQAPG